MERYNIAIIGTGPAGLEAAITAKIRNKSIILIGSSNLSSKIEKAHSIKNYLGLPEISGDELQKRFIEHLASLDIQILDERINTVYAMGEYFALQGHKDMYEAETVILATGMATVNPFPGELEWIGRGVSYCATCDATLYKNKKAVVIGYSSKEESEADFLAELADEVIYIPMYKNENSFRNNVKVINGVKPISIERSESRMLLKCDTDSFEADGIFILRESVIPTQLVPGLSIENNQVVVDRQQNTNIPGLFACGDITGAPYQYIKAAGEGNVAALSAVSYLDHNF